jgi:hypothetical protein
MTIAVVNAFCSRVAFVISEKGTVVSACEYWESVQREG